VSRQTVLPMAHLDSSAKSDLEGGFWALKLPGIVLFKPVLWVFVLPAIFHGRAEQSVVVANAISERRNRQARHALHEAGREATKPAVAEGGVRFDGPQVVEINTEIGERRPHRLRPFQNWGGSAKVGVAQEHQTQ